MPVARATARQVGYIAQASSGVFRIVKSLGVIDPLPPSLIEREVPDAPDFTPTPAPAPHAPSASA
jgi:hypothetical protein